VKEAALLHDVGKMDIADNVLAKPGKLDEQEWAAMRPPSRSRLRDHGPDCVSPWRGDYPPPSPRAL